MERVVKGWVEAERAQAVAGSASSSLGWATPIPSTRVLAETVQAHPTLGLRAVAVSSSEVLTEPGKMAEMQGLVRGVVREAIEQGQKAGRGRAGPAERAERETAFAPAGAAATGSAAAATAAAAAAAAPAAAAAAAAAAAGAAGSSSVHTGLAHVHGGGVRCGSAFHRLTASQPSFPRMPLMPPVPQPPRDGAVFTARAAASATTASGSGAAQQLGGGAPVAAPPIAPPPVAMARPSAAPVQEVESASASASSTLSLPHDGVAGCTRSASTGRYSFSLAARELLEKVAACSS